MLTDTLLYAYILGNLISLKWIQHIHGFPFHRLNGYMIGPNMNTAYVPDEYRILLYNMDTIRVSTKWNMKVLLCACMGIFQMLLGVIAANITFKIKSTLYSPISLQGNSTEMTGQGSCIVTWRLHPFFLSCWNHTQIKFNIKVIFMTTV